jgi:hypothetical protein
MSVPIENHERRGPLDGRIIDRLVDGELPNVERRELLLRLETEPGGWRQCALAFLEAQSWREALGPLAVPARGLARSPEMSIGPGKKPNPWRPVARLTALAGGLAAAFALGWTFHRGPPEDAPSAPLASVENSALAAASGPSPPAPVDVAGQESRPSKLDELPALVDPVVKRWEQRGYHAETQKRLVSMKLNDGRRLDVPVHEVRLRYIGDRTY